MSPRAIHDDLLTVAGRVVDPQGRSVPGATVQAVYIGVNHYIKPTPGSSGPDGPWHQ